MFAPPTTSAGAMPGSLPLLPPQGPGMAPMPGLPLLDAGPAPGGGLPLLSSGTDLSAPTPPSGAQPAGVTSPVGGPAFMPPKPPGPETLQYATETQADGSVLMRVLAPDGTPGPVVNIVRPSLPKGMKG